MAGAAPWGPKAGAAPWGSKAGTAPWGPKAGATAATHVPARGESRQDAGSGGGGAETGGVPRGRPSRRNKRVYRAVDLASLDGPPAPAPGRGAGASTPVAPPDYRAQTNGITPMAIRHPEYAPADLLGRDIHRTFANAFESVAPSAAAAAPCYEQSRFAMKEDEFPTLGK